MSDPAREALQQAGIRHCRICLCVEERACAGGCWWVEQDLCSACDPGTDLRCDAIDAENEGLDPEEELDMTCGLHPDGQCTLAGSEFCEFECGRAG